ncbi:hypothetical protein ACQ3VH_25805 [Bacillus pretiosus]|uniref:hypothetical protein n=1 Tax=Bacillus TaxID=1386 RepID=UPI0021021EE3|nr:hypothetical protein [Bacillus sp. AR2-1]
MYTWLFLCSNFLPVGSIASAVALCGGLFIMVGSQEQGFPLISRAGIVYIVVQMISLFMRLLVGIAKAIFSYTSRAFLLTVIPQYARNMQVCILYLFGYFRMLKLNIRIFVCNELKSEIPN